MGEIATGFMMVLYGLSFLAERLFPEGPASAFLGLGQPLLLLCGWVLAGKAVKKLKERITYPRTGYVSYPKKQTPKRMTRALILGAAVSFSMVFVTLAVENARVLLPLLSGGAGALVLVILGYRLGLPRFYVMAVMTLLLGGLTAWLPLEMIDEYAFFFTIFGLMWMISGGVTLIRYLRQTEPAGETL